MEGEGWLLGEGEAEADAATGGGILELVGSVWIIDGGLQVQPDGQLLVDVIISRGVEGKDLLTGGDQVVHLIDATEDGFVRFDGKINLEVQVTFHPGFFPAAAQG